MRKNNSCPLLKVFLIILKVTVWSLNINKSKQNGSFVLNWFLLWRFVCPQNEEQDSRDYRGNTLGRLFHVMKQRCYHFSLEICPVDKKKENGWNVASCIL